MAIRISETFTSVQGEGMLTGVPSFFVRLSGCNLRCSWCDTPYASWNPEGDTCELASLVEQAQASGTRHVVITGGEPMMFRELPAIARAMQHAGMHVTIETAGTIDVSGEHGPIVVDLMSISPKLSTSTPWNDPRDPSGEWARRHEERRLNIPVLQSLIDRHPAGSRQFKFVVSGEHSHGGMARAESDLREIDAILTHLRGVLPHEIMLMPEGIATPTPTHRQFVLAACIARGWRYCTRLHIDLFGHVRGT